VTATLKHLANGAKIPNWAKLVAMGALLAWNAATALFGHEKTAIELRAYIGADSLRTKAILTEVRSLQTKEDRRNSEINYELDVIGKRVGYIARRID
jgi:hypothetical protein